MLHMYVCIEDLSGYKSCYCEPAIVNAATTRASFSPPCVCQDTLDTQDVTKKKGHFETTNERPKHVIHLTITIDERESWQGSDQQGFDRLRLVNLDRGNFASAIRPQASNYHALWLAFALITTPPSPQSR